MREGRRTRALGLGLCCVCVYFAVWGWSFFSPLRCWVRVHATAQAAQKTRSLTSVFVVKSRSRCDGVV